MTPGRGVGGLPLDSPLASIREWIARIPRGRVATYGQLAQLAGYPRAPRLTVRALRGSHALPWHRVVAAGGRIALSGDEGQEQRLRLAIEGVRFRGGRVDLATAAWHPRSRGRRGPSLASRARKGFPGED